MRLRHWLLIGSSVSLMTIAPAGITVAQDAGLTDACVSAGITTPDDCAAFEKQLTPEQAAPEEQAPAEEAAPPAEEQAAPPAEEAAPPAEEQAPAEEAAPPAEEQAAPPPEEPAPAEEAAPPAEEAAPPAEEPAPAQEEAAPPAEQQAPAGEAAPPVEEQAPAEEAAPPAEEQAPAEEAAPPAEQQQAPAEEAAPPAEEQQAPAEEAAPPAEEQQAPAEEATPPAEEQAAPPTEEAAPAEQQAPAEEAPAPAEQAPADEQQAPTQQEQPAPEQPAQPGAEQPAAEQPGEAATPPNPEQVQEELQNDPALQDQPKEDVTDLPAGVDPNAVAPLLDSAKDEVTAIESGTAPAEEQQAPAAEGQQPAEQQQPAEAGPPPDSDAAAQAPIQVEAQEVKTMEAEQGEPLDAPPPIEVPQNVTIVNNNTTVVNNNTQVNNTNITNNTVNNVDNTAIVVEVGNHYVISNPTQDRARVVQQDDEVYYEQLSRGRVRETIEKPDGTKVVTVRNRYGEVLQRSRITPDGREYILAYYNPQADQDEDQVFYGDVGSDLPPLRLTIPIDQYVLDASSADEGQLQTFLAQPPVEQVRRLYTVAEVKHSARIRDTVRRLELGDLTFDTGKATIARDQVDNLSDVANAMQALLANNPAETFLIEGHTDAVGSDLANLRLSDQRANTVAQVLTDFYNIPPENLATQGYGERYLKIKTDEAERENRRVTIRRITPLITPVASR